MKTRKVLLIVLISLCTAVLMSPITVTAANSDIVYEDNENYLKNGSFEDWDNIEMIVPEGFTCTLSQDLEASAGVYSLKVQSNNNYAHIGYPLALEEGRTYEYSFDIKLVSDANGNSVDTSTAMYVNFMFADSNASNQQKNHVLTGTSATSQSGWHHVKGTYTPSYDEIAADADLENALFCIYANPTPGGGAIWLLDNVVLKRKPLESEEDIVKTPDFISDNMLIQMGKQFPIWGTVSDAETLDIVLYNGNTVVCRASAILENGGLEAELPAVNEYLKNLTLAFESGGKTLRTIENVAVGELWHFSGQSNMEMPSRDEMPDIHYFRVNATGEGEWVTISTSDIRTISAVAYKTLETLYNGLGSNAPVGGLNTAVGGMPMSKYMENEEKYLSHLVPISKIPVKGHFWYQGESDMNNTNYVSDIEAMIASWRTLWNDETQPFIYVQLPRSCATIPDWYGNLDANGNPTMAWCYNYTRVHMWQYEAYQKLKNNSVYMVVSIDATTKIEEQKSVENRNAEDPLHPWNKAPIAARLGNTALHEIYGKTDVKHEFPMPSDISVDGKYIYIEYSGVYDGLSTHSGAAPEHFEIIDADGNYHAPTHTEIYSNNTVMLYCDNVEEPAGISYFHEEHLLDLSLPFAELVPSLKNSAGLPASPFTYTITEDDRITSFSTISVPAGSVVCFADGSAKSYADASNVRVPEEEGYIYVNTGYTGHTVYSVTADGVPTKLDILENALLGYNGAGIRTNGVRGIRFRSSVLTSAKELALLSDGYQIQEYGFIVTAETDATGLKNTSYTLDMSLVTGGKAIKGVAYSKAENKDIVFETSDNRTVFTSVLKNIPLTKTALTATVASRPYYILSDGENEIPVYGQITKRSVYSVAKAIKDANGTDYADNKAYIDEIIDIVGISYELENEITFDASELFKN